MDFWQRKDKPMMKMVVPAGVAVLVAVAALTNPGEQAHAGAVIAHAKGQCADTMLVRDICGGVASLATLAMHYDDHLLFSNARIGDMKTMGVFGRVMVISE